MADKAGQPYSVGQTLTAASSAIIQSQRFPLAMREWHKLPPIARTWAAFKATLLEEQKNERDNGVAPENAYTQSANSHTTNDALNNLAAATAADRQAAANQAEAVANLTVSNQNLAQQLQQAQQQLQKTMTTMHSPTTAPGGGHRASPSLAAPIAPLIPARDPDRSLQRHHPITTVPPRHERMA